MTIIKERMGVEESRELILVGDTVKLVDSPYDRLKKGAKGKVMNIHGDLVADPDALMQVRFKLTGSEFLLTASAIRFRFTKHPKAEDGTDAELPDAEAETLEIDEA